MRFVIWGHPKPHNGATRVTSLRRAIFIWLLRIYYFAPLALVPPTPPLLRCRCFSFWGFFSCVLLFLFVLVLLFVACLFPSVAWLGWRWLVVAAPGCCVRLLVPFLARWCGVVLPLVVVLLPLPWLPRGWLVLRCVCVLGGVLSAGLSGLSPSLWFVSFFGGGSSPFFCVKERSL